MLRKAFLAATALCSTLVAGLAVAQTETVAPNFTNQQVMKNGCTFTQSNSAHWVRAAIVVTQPFAIEGDVLEPGTVLFIGAENTSDRVTVLPDNDFIVEGGDSVPYFVLDVMRMVGRAERLRVLCTSALRT